MGTFSKDDYDTAGRAALVGGTTTIFDMCCPARDTSPEEGFRLWSEKSAGRAACDYSFHMGVTRFDDASADHAHEVPGHDADQHQHRPVDDEHAGELGHAQATLQEPHDGAQHEGQRRHEGDRQQRIAQDVADPEEGREGGDGRPGRRLRAAVAGPPGVPGRHGAIPVETSTVRSFQRTRPRRCRRAAFTASATAKA